MDNIVMVTKKTIFCLVWKNDPPKPLPVSYIIRKQTLLPASRLEWAVKLTKGSCYSKKAQGVRNYVA